MRASRYYIPICIFDNSVTKANVHAVTV